MPANTVNASSAVNSRVVTLDCSEKGVLLTKHGQSLQSFSDVCVPHLRAPTPVSACLLRNVGA